MRPTRQPDAGAGPLPPNRLPPREPDAGAGGAAPERPEPERKARARIRARIRADTWGTLGAILVALCALGVPPLPAMLARLRLAFLLHDPVLLPLLLLFLGAAVWGIRREAGREPEAERGPKATKRRKAGPLALAVAAAALVAGGLWLTPSAVALGLVLLASASAWSRLRALREGGAAGPRLPPA